MKLTIYRGTHEIGGNCVEIATDSTRIVVDVGMPLFKANREPFDDRVIQGKSIDELLEAKICEHRLENAAPIGRKVQRSGLEESIVIGLRVG